MIKFENAEQKVVMSSLVQKLENTPYSKLVEAFGEPTLRDHSGDGKVQVEWQLRFNSEEYEDVIATIYDYKSYTIPEANDYWSIGGFSIEAAWCVREVLENV